MSLFHGILLAAFLLLDMIFVVACVVYVGKRQELLRAEKKCKPQKHASETLAFAMSIEFALLWSAFVLFFDYIMYVRDAAKQFQTLSYVAVEGEILKCGVIEKRDSEGTTRELEVEYAYGVHDREYRNTVVRHLNHWSNASRTAFVAAHPPRTRLLVFYDPNEPAQAVIFPGLGGTELLAPLVLLPFNLVMLAFWYAGILFARHGKIGLRTVFIPGARILEADERLRVRISSMAPAAGGLICVGILSVPVFMVVSFCVGLPASVAAAVSAWGIVLGSGMLVYLYIANRAGSGKFDLVVDRLSRTLTLPQTLGRSEPVDVPLANLLALEVVTVPYKENGNRYVPTVRWRGAAGEAQEGKLAEWRDEEQAEELVAWIRAKVAFTSSVA